METSNQKFQNFIQLLNSLNIESIVSLGDTLNWHSGGQSHRITECNSKFTYKVDGYLYSNNDIPEDKILLLISERCTPTK